MHEYPITEQIVKIALKHLSDSGADKVTAINLVLGENSGIVPESIHMYFDLIAENTPCSEAKIIVTRIKPTLICPACGTEFVRKPMAFDCPACGTDGHPTETGKEFYLDSIEVE